MTAAPERGLGADAAPPSSSAPAASLGAPACADACSGDPGAPLEGSAPPILFVIFQSGRLSNGGVESISHIIRRLRGFRPILVTQLETPATKKWRDAGWEVHVWRGPDRLDTPSLVARARKIPDLLAFDIKMALFVRRAGVRVVHCNDISSFWYAAPGAKAAGARVVFSVRSVFALERPYGMKWIGTRLLADHIVFLSEEMRAALARRMPSPRLIGAAAASEVIHSIVELREMRPVPAPARAEVRSRLGIRPDEIALGYVGYVGDVKNQLDFIERAAPVLLRGALPIRIYFVGDFQPDRDPYARRCLEAAARLGLEDRLRFIGFSEAIRDWYRALDVVFVASRHEGLARCMIESLACGTPVVSFDLCSAREILERHGCGVVVPYGDFSALADALRALACDPGRRQELSIAGARVARALFDPDRIVRAYEALYTRLEAPPVAARR